MKAYLQAIIKVKLDLPEHTTMKDIKDRVKDMIEQRAYTIKKFRISIGDTIQDGDDDE